MGKLSKVKWCLLGCLIVAVALLASSVLAPNRLTNTVSWVANNDFACKLRALSERQLNQERELIEMVVETVAVSQIDYQPVVILKEKGEELYLPIWIGILEASAISAVLEGVEVPRPLTSDLLCSVIDSLGATVDYIVISDLQNDTFYANIVLDANWTQMKIDARPSDAIAIALRVNAPIYAEKRVLDEAGIQLDHETEKYTVMHAEEHKWMSVSKCFILR